MNYNDWTGQQQQAIRPCELREIIMHQPVTKENDCNTELPKNRVAVKAEKELK